MPPQGYIQTFKDRCRVCFTCVRECPAKAIRIQNGQAEVIPERCIACGNCTQVCSQGAKQFIRTTSQVLSLLSSGEKVIACVAPSFPAEFPEYHFTVFVGLLRGLGFSKVTEVAFGADLVADRYQRLLAEKGGEKYIAANCPAVVSYIEKYHPEMVGSLAPIASPMSAMGRALDEIYGRDYKKVFIGPCIAKKNEAEIEEAGSSMDCAITFGELQELILSKGLTPQNTEPSDFDLPHPSTGALLPLSRGLLQAATIDEDLMQGDVVTAEGPHDFTAAIEEIVNGKIDIRLLEILACNGCIMGPGMTTCAPMLARRLRVSDYVRYRASSLDRILWRNFMDSLAGLDLSRTFTPCDQRIKTPAADEVRGILIKMGKKDAADELNCGACGYHTCREHAIAISKGIAESEMCLPYTIEKIKETADKLSKSYAELEKTQHALVQSEKLASMGQLAAGIAHEINNPLGVVLLYAHLLKDNFPAESAQQNDIQMIVDQAERCKKIVGGLLNFARKNRVNKRLIDVVNLIKRSISVVIIPKEIKIVEDYPEKTIVAEIDPDQMAQVFTNIITNAVEAMSGYGELTISVRMNEDLLEISFTDTGPGMDPETQKMAFEPFFTTKKIGKGMGLGLSVGYGIVKMHNGSLTVESNRDPKSGPVGTTFTIKVPSMRPHEFGFSRDHREQ